MAQSDYIREQGDFTKKNGVSSKVEEEETQNY